MRFSPELVVLAALVMLATGGAAADRIEFNRDIRPILSDNCFLCHGFDQQSREAGLRLDEREAALEAGAIVPGDPDASALVRRILSENPNHQMPPPSSERALSSAEKALLAEWVQQGAEYAPHWAYVSPVRKAPAAPKTRDWIRNPIDAFVLERLEREGLAPAEPADPITLIRRLSFDLRGLPPSQDEVAAFVADTSPDAYERLVEDMLASPHYGERMAVNWLDVVRYADTNGYHGDEHRSVWPYRDYVINAFNTNKPFDVFTREQIAGDLLPESTREQQVAAAFNRLNQLTAEGGAQAKEYLAKYAADRVRTVSTAWLGSTMGCAECHDHKFDPFTMKDFYGMQAYFADIQEQGVYGAGQRWDPILELPTPEQEAALAGIHREIAALETQLDTPTEALAAGQARWEAQVIAELAGATPAPRRLPEPVLAALQVAAEARDVTQREHLATYYRTFAPELAPVRETLEAAREREEALRKELPFVLATVSVEPREIRVLPRGDWLDESGEVMQPIVPAFLAAEQAHTEARSTRLELAEWLVAPENPLTARVYVNRLWAQFFGTGLSRVLDDLGSQGEWPSHPELLDWLAVEFRESGWDIKHVVRLVVQSATYRQSSMPREDLKERDPFNRLLARQSRFRLEAELVRDNALAVSGLLATKIGGRSVFPYQPDGYWDNCNTFTGPLIYHTDEGEEQYRRGLYTYWKRSFLHPSMLAFDAPTREECTAERVSSNTPLQALVLLNDPTYVEAARVLAARIWREGGEGVSDRITWAFQQVLSRAPNDAEAIVLANLYVMHRNEFAAAPQEAVALVSTGQAPVPDAVDPAELAAWASVARVILNLHETITRT